jgi:hypothetical protein
VLPPFAFLHTHTHTYPTLQFLLRFGPSLNGSSSLALQLLVVGNVHENCIRNMDEQSSMVWYKKKLFMVSEGQIVTLFSMSKMGTSGSFLNSFNFFTRWTLVILHGFFFTSNAIIIGGVSQIPKPSVLVFFKADECSKKIYRTMFLTSQHITFERNLIIIEYWIFELKTSELSVK